MTNTAPWKSAFTDPRAPNGAQFEGMSAATAPAHKLYITRVLHKAFVEVGEEGTEAAAATAVVLAEPQSAPATFPFTPTFKADRPFVFLIRDRKSGAVLSASEPGDTWRLQGTTATTSISTSQSSPTRAFTPTSVLAGGRAASK